MKQSRYYLALAFAAALAVHATGCTTTPGTPMTAAQTQAKYTNDVGQAESLVNELTIASTSAINADVLKSKDADNVIAAIKVAKDGLALTRSLVLSGQLTASQGSARAAITIAVLTASQTYLATLAKPAPGAKT